jgi:hypothetical protein
MATTTQRKENPSPRYVNNDPDLVDEVGVREHGTYVPVGDTPRSTSGMIIALLAVAAVVLGGFYLYSSDTTTPVTPISSAPSSEGTTDPVPPATPPVQPPADPTPTPPAPSDTPVPPVVDPAPVTPPSGTQNN